MTAFRPTFCPPQGPFGWAVLVALGVVGSLALAQPGPYAPAAGQPGSTALPANDARVLLWANTVMDYTPGAALDDVWKKPAQALGPVAPASSNDSAAVVSLGQGGSITLGFARPLRDGPGADFAVFENSFNDFFLELAFVEVSSDGGTFHRFPNASLTAAPVTAFGSVDTRNVDGLAGKYRRGFGTPFDLAVLAGRPGLDVQAVRFVRLVDVLGNGSTFDSAGRPIYAPYPTAISAGFDLDGVAALHVAAPLPRLATVVADTGPARLRLSWAALPNRRYVIEFAEPGAPTGWTPLETLAPGTADYLVPESAALAVARWYRVREEAPD